MLNKYRIQLTQYMVYTVYDQNIKDAANQVWADIKDGFTYGYQSAQDILDHALITQEPDNGADVLKNSEPNNECKSGKVFSTSASLDNYMAWMEV